PLYNYGQGDRVRLLAEMQVSQDEYAVMQIAALSQVREAFAQVDNARQRAELYALEMLPLYERNLASALRQYNFMSLGAYEVLEVKRQGVQAQIDYSQALYDYGVAQARLTLATGH